MATDEVSNNYEATTANSNAHIGYSGVLRQQGDDVATAMVEGTKHLGDLYHEFKHAVHQVLAPAARDAHYRLADLHEAYGQKGLNTVQILNAADEDGAAGIGQSTAGATPPDPTT